jgi:hypothetical protein
MDSVGLDAGSVETSVDARRRSSGALADANPFLWFQLVDDRGAILSHETFLGRGVGIERKVQARIHMPAFVGLSLPPESDGAARKPREGSVGTRLASGLHARIVVRTYCNTTGPRYHAETLMLTLLGAGAEFTAAAISKAPALIVVPGRPDAPAPIAPAAIGSAL